MMVGIRRILAIPILLTLDAFGSGLFFVWGLSSSAPKAPATSQGTSTSIKQYASKGTITSMNQEELASIKFPRTWVPLCSTYELDPDRPSPVDFLGQNYVVYQDNSKNWIVMDDTCPHRLAPLSEGRVDRKTDTLDCSYHGWKFTSGGECTTIPQATEDATKSFLSTPKSCVATYPTSVEKNVVWIWPWKEDPLSIAGNVAAHPEGMMSGMADETTTYTRDLPYGWDTLVENIVDPSHVPFAHHGLQGKRTDAVPINMTVPTSKGESGFEFEWSDRTMGMTREGVGEFRAPYVVNYNATFNSDPPRPFNLMAICIPTKPGWSRIMLVNPRSTSTRSKKAPIVLKIFQSLPIWMIHQLSNIFLDSDLAFLHHQERERERRPDYYLPAPADRCIAALRKWIPKYVDTSKVLQPLPPSPLSSSSTRAGTLPRSMLFDRYSQHTQNCKECQRGLQTLQKIKRGTYAILAMSILSGLRPIIARVALLLGLAVLRGIAKLENSFRVGEYKHYTKHD